MELRTSHPDACSEYAENHRAKSLQAKLESVRQDSDRIVSHVTSVERIRQEQIEAEDSLRTLLELKTKVAVQSLDRHAHLM